MKNAAQPLMTAAPIWTAVKQNLSTMISTARFRMEIAFLMDPVALLPVDGLATIVGTVADFLGLAARLLDARRLLLSAAIASDAENLGIAAAAAVWAENGADCSAAALEVATDALAL